MMSLGRCQLAVTVATPTLAAQTQARHTTSPRNRYGTTIASAHISDIATAAWPLGKLWSSRRYPWDSRIGRDTDRWITSAVTTDAAITPTPTNPSRIRRRTNPISRTRITAAMTDDTVMLSRVSSARTCSVLPAMVPPARSTASSKRCPSGVQTASR